MMESNQYYLTDFLLGLVFTLASQGQLYVYKAYLARIRKMQADYELKFKDVIRDTSNNNENQTEQTPILVWLLSKFSPCWIYGMNLATIHWILEMIGWNF